MEKEKILLQISDPLGNKAFPIEASLLPKEVRSKIGDDRTYLLFKLKKRTKGVELVDVMYFREVKKFKKGTTEISLKDDTKFENVIFGI